MRIILVDVRTLPYKGAMFVDNGTRTGTIVKARRVESDWGGNYFAVQIIDAEGNLRWLQEGTFYPIYSYKPTEAPPAPKSTPEFSNIIPYTKEMSVRARELIKDVEVEE